MTQSNGAVDRVGLVTCFFLEKKQECVHTNAHANKMATQWRPKLKGFIKPACPMPAARGGWIHEGWMRHPTTVWSVIMPVVLLEGNKNNEGRWTGQWEFISSCQSSRSVLRSSQCLFTFFLFPVFYYHLLYCFFVLFGFCFQSRKANTCQTLLDVTRAKKNYIYGMGGGGL